MFLNARGPPASQSTGRSTLFAGSHKRPSVGQFGLSEQCVKVTVLRAVNVLGITKQPFLRRKLFVTVSSPGTTAKTRKTADTRVEGHIAKWNQNLDPFLVQPSSRLIFRLYAKRSAHPDILIGTHEMPILASQNIPCVLMFSDEAVQLWWTQSQSLVTLLAVVTLYVNVNVTPGANNSPPSIPTSIPTNDDDSPAEGATLSERFADPDHFFPPWPPIERSTVTTGAPSPPNLYNNPPSIATNDDDSPAEEATISGPFPDIQPFLPPRPPVEEWFVRIGSKTASRSEGIASSPGREGDTMGVKLKDVQELSSPGAPFKDHLFITSTDIDSGVFDISGEACNMQEYEAHRRKLEKRDREEQEKPAVPPVRLRNADQLKIYRHLFSFLADKINSMKALDPRLDNLLPRLHTHIEKFVDYDIIVSISESRKFRETLIEASLVVGDKGYSIALDNDGEEMCALFQEVLLDSKCKRTIRSLRKEQARDFMQELQEALKSGSPLLQEHQLQRTAQRILIDLSKACGDVPDELYVKEKIEKVSLNPKYVGGFGHIHCGLYNGRPVALKRLFTLENVALVQAFCKEAMIWKKLCGHPHILAFLGVDIESFPGEMCMVSEWMGKGTIIEFLKREPHHAVEKYLLQIAEGIQHLHSQGMYHGDLKGANILVSGNREAKIADFGFANFADMSVSYATVRMGTPKWMAPELLDTSRKFQRTTKSDIFAFACIAFEIYTGAPIFPDDDNVRACRRILAGERSERPTDGGRMPNRMWDLIKWCWSQEPSSRPPMDIVVRELQKVDGCKS